MRHLFGIDKSTHLNFGTIQERKTKPEKGIGVIDSTDLPEKQFKGSRQICSPLVKLIIDQG